MKLGHNKSVKKDHQAVADRAERATERRKRKPENELAEERRTKMMNVDEPGETVKDIFEFNLLPEHQNSELSPSQAADAGENVTVSSDLKLENDLSASGHGHEMGV